MLIGLLPFSMNCATTLSNINININTVKTVPCVYFSKSNSELMN